MRSPEHRSARAAARIRTGSARRQRGAALVVALLVVATVAVLATALASDFLLLFRRVENQLYSEQAYAYLLGAEGLARAALLQDLQRDGRAGKALDYLSEDWAKAQSFPTDHGAIGGYIEDMQGRFNLNTLAGAPGAGTGQGSALTPAQLQLLRLLQALPLPEPLAPDQAQALTEAIADWIDKDDEVSGLGGAESDYYAAAQPPGRPANRDLASPSELMWVRGMTPAIYRALAPLVTVWPGGRMPGAKSININTAPALVLASLGDANSAQPLGAQEVEQIVQDRQQKNYFGSVDELRAESVLRGRNIDTGALTVRSDYFMLNAQTDFQGRRYSLHSLLYRDAGKRTVRVVARTFGEW
jgi:general secretion pathway protein K